VPKKTIPPRAFLTSAGGDEEQVAATGQRSHGEIAIEKCKGNGGFLF